MALRRFQEFKFSLEVLILLAHQIGGAKLDLAGENTGGPPHLGTW